MTWKVEEQVELSYLYYSGYNGTGQKDPQVDNFTIDTNIFLCLHSMPHTLSLNLCFSVAECRGLYLPSKWHTSYKPWKTGLKCFSEMEYPFKASYITFFSKQLLKISGSGDCCAWTNSRWSASTNQSMDISGALLV